MGNWTGFGTKSYFVLPVLGNEANLLNDNILTTQLV